MDVTALVCTDSLGVRAAASAVARATSRRMPADSAAAHAAVSASARDNASDVGRVEATTSNMASTSSAAQAGSPCQDDLSLSRLGCPGVRTDFMLADFRMDTLRTAGSAVSSGTTALVSSCDETKLIRQFCEQKEASSAMKTLRKASVSPHSRQSPSERIAVRS